MKARKIVSNIKNRLLYGEIEYVPKNLASVQVITSSKSRAWSGLEAIIPDILNRFGVSRQSALEFGVEYGYSLSCFSSLFEKVTGVDTFLGDSHSGENRDFYETTKSNLSQLTNINLVRSDYRSFISSERIRWNLIHIDIVHTYQDTYECGLWSLNHADIVLFHDTQSFKPVKRAVANLAREFKLPFFNYPYLNGLGILRIN